MGRIQSSIGLISGVPIGDTVDKLMKLESRPRDNLDAATKKIDQERAAITELSALVIATQYVVKNLGKPAVYDKRLATSSNDSSLSATITGTPPIGSYLFTPVRTAQSEQWLASGVESSTAALGGGAIAFRFGSDLARSTPLDQLRGGAGFERGVIRITDRSGSSADIDLTTVQTLEDVLAAINGNTRISVQAEAVGDHIRLTDRTGMSLTNLRVQEIGGGSTAASLGLAGIDVAASSADGNSIVFVTGDTHLSQLNDGMGVGFHYSLPEISFQLRDGTTGVIDFNALIPGGSEHQQQRTLADVVQTINQASPDKLRAEISADGKRLVVTDLTSGTEQFQLSSLYGTSTLQDLGLDTTAADGVITGRSLVGGLQSVLLSSLNGGRGWGNLGSITITDRGGAEAVVDLSSAETVEDVLTAINSAGIGVTASLNRAKTGLLIQDTTSGSGNLKIADADATQTAQKLGIAVDAAVAEVNSGDLHLQSVSLSTQLSEFNGGKGVARGKFTVTDSRGARTTVDLTSDDVQTIGDVIRKINGGAAQVYAEINEQGDGIWIRDTAGGAGKPSVSEGTSTTAKDLNLLAAPVEKTIDSTTYWVIDGSTTRQIELSAEDSLDDLTQKINDLNAGLRATVLFDGSSRPYRLNLTGEGLGALGRMVIDASELGLDLNRIAEARDAQLAVGSLQVTGTLIVSSHTNSFSGVVPGLTLDVKQASATPVMISVQNTDADLTASVQAFVDNYNKYYKRLQELTKYDVDTDTKQILTGDATVLRLESDLTRLLSGRFSGVGDIRSLGELGIGFKDDGTLEFDSAKLKDKFAESPDAVKRFFTDSDQGFAAKFDKLLEALTGKDVSLMAQRFISLSRKYEENTQKLEWWDAKLERRREQLLLYFYRMETAIAKLQGQMNVLSAIKPLDMSFLSQSNNS
ncbi:MAG: flagellar filament capping protein FliD [Thermogutta sp.]